MRCFRLTALFALVAGTLWLVPFAHAEDGDDDNDRPDVRRVADWSFEKPPLTVGTLFDVTLPSMADGQPVSLRQFRGQKVLLHVFASW